MWRGGWSGVRTVGYAESDHFGDFSDPVEIFSHDEQDPAGMQFYTNAATKLGEQLYVMFPAAFYTKQQTVRDHLAWSRDGVHFTRYGRQPVVDLGAGFDSRSIYVAPGSVPSDAPNTWWFYYFASKEEHDTDAANIHSAGGIGRFLLAVDEPPVNADALKPMIEIKWRLGPDYPMGIQDSAVGMIHGKLISAGGFTRHPKDIVKQYPDAFGGEPSGFTKLAFALDPKDESAGWKRIADLPGPARQGMSVAVVDNRFYVMGGINYTEPLTYRDTYRLQEKDGRYDWEKLETCQLPWPVYGASAGTAVIGEKIYLFGAADYFKSPGTDGADFHSEGGRADSPVGKALLVLDTTNLGAGWKRLADCPGVPTFDTAFAAAGGKLYRLSGIFGPLSKSELSYYNAVDSWMYDPAADTWTRLRDMPHGCNQRALVYADRYIVLVTRFVYSKTRNPDGSATDVYDPKKITPPFEKTVQVYDIVTGQLGTATPLLEQTCFPGAAVDGDTLYCLGGEGGPRLYHPATLQIGKVLNVIPR
jgi:hypothetical protein